MRRYVKTVDGKYEIWSGSNDEYPMAIVDSMEEVRNNELARKVLDCNIQMVLDIMTFPHGLFIDGEQHVDIEKMKKFNGWYTEALQNQDTPFPIAVQTKLAELTREIFGQDQLNEAIENSLDIFKHNR